MAFSVIHFALSIPKSDPCSRLVGLLSGDFVSNCELFYLRKPKRRMFNNDPYSFFPFFFWSLFSTVDSSNNFVIFKFIS